MITYRVCRLPTAIKHGHKPRLWQLAWKLGTFRYWLGNPEFRDRIALAEEDGKIVGWIALREPVIGWFVDPDYRGRGIARRLTQTLLGHYAPKTIYCQPESPHLVKMLVDFGYKLIDPGQGGKKWEYTKVTQMPINRKIYGVALPGDE